MSISPCPVPSMDSSHGLAADAALAMLPDVNKEFSVAPCFSTLLAGWSWWPSTGSGLALPAVPALCALQCSTGSLSCSMFNKCSSGPLHCWSAACSIFNNIGIVLVAVCALCIATCIVHNCYTILLCVATCCCTIVLCVSSVALPSCSRAGNDPIPVLALDYHHHCHHRYLYHRPHHFKWHLIHYSTNVKSWYIQNL